MKTMLYAVALISTAIILAELLIVDALMYVVAINDGKKLKK
jgi:hypothetical protein